MSDRPRFRSYFDDEQECWNVIDLHSRQSHDRDDAHELICRVFEPDWAKEIVNLLIKGAGP